MITAVGVVVPAHNEARRVRCVPGQHKGGSGGAALACGECNMGNC